MTIFIPYLRVLKQYMSSSYKEYSEGKKGFVR
jgi:hypothetical protein